MSVSTHHAPSVPMITAGARPSSASSRDTSVATPARKASAMPCRAGHIPFSRNQPAAVTAWSSATATASAAPPTCAVPATSSASAPVTVAGSRPGAMSGEPLARVGAASGRA
ncbi:hypothetical protein AN219_09625, partial [Streptomyces nanshensis]